MILSANFFRARVRSTQVDNTTAKAGRASTMAAKPIVVWRTASPSSSFALPSNPYSNSNHNKEPASVAVIILDLSTSPMSTGPFCSLCGGFLEDYRRPQPPDAQLKWTQEVRAGTYTRPGSFFAPSQLGMSVHKEKELIHNSEKLPELDTAILDGSGICPRLHALRR